MFTFVYITSINIPNLWISSKSGSHILRIHLQCYIFVAFTENMKIYYFDKSLHVNSIGESQKLPRPWREKHTQCNTDETKNLSLSRARKKKTPAPCKWTCLQYILRQFSRQETLETRRKIHREREKDPYTHSSGKGGRKKCFVGFPY